jgi:hypothetical protein
MILTNEHDRDKVISHIQAEENKSVFIGKMRKRYGLKLFECQLETGKIQQMVPKSKDAKYREIPVIYDFGQKPKMAMVIDEKYEYRENCMYAQAINLKNAKKKFIAEMARRAKDIAKNIKENT